MQAHCNARYVIYRVLNEVDGFIKVDVDDDNFTVSIDRSKIMSHGMPKLMDFLLKLQVYKSTADIENATLLFGKYSEVNDYHLNIRKITLDKKKPRSIFAQPYSYIDDNDNVQLKSYDSNVEGIINSVCDNYPL